MAGRSGRPRGGPRGRPGGPRGARPRVVAGSPGPVRLPAAPSPTAQYLPARAAGGLLFVSGHDPETGGRLRYRGRVGRDLTLEAARAATRLATLNALASARVAAGSLRGLRRCVALTCFVDATPDALRAAITADATALLRTIFGPAARPLVWLRPASHLAGGMPVEVELLFELTPRQDRRGSRRVQSTPRAGPVSV